tara:strand:+ start:260 stop:544 length:285 start_codon:yes stop_codon:yes gene_type:complete
MKYLLIALLLTTPIYAKTGKQLYKKCISCHGNKGQGRGTFPKLAGQHARYLVKQLKDIKSKKRKVPQMNSVVKKLTKEDMKSLAKYLQSLKGCK